jgi:hypothetical protein
MTEVDDIHKRDSEHITERRMRGKGMEKQLIIISIMVFLVCVVLNGYLGIGFLIFDGIIWFTAKNLYEVTRKTT